MNPPALGRVWSAPANAVNSGRANRTLVLRQIQDSGAISRTRLAEATGLAAGTISNAVRDLMDLRLVAPTGELAPRGRGAAGAPSPLVGLERSWHRVLCVHQGVSRIRLGLADLTGTILSRNELAVIPGEPWERTLGRVAGGLQKLAEGLDPGQIRGTGFGAVGLVDRETGRVRAAPNLGWKNVPVRAALEADLPWPVAVRNNVHGMAIAEMRFQGVPEEHALYVYVGTGIGSGIIGPGGVQSGAHGGAGEIGHVVVPGGGPCKCGKVGCLETVAAEPAIARRAEPAATDHKAAVARLVERAAEGDRAAIALIGDAGRGLGQALAQVVEILDPGAILISGILAEAGETFLKPLDEALRDSTFVARDRPVGVRAAHFGREAGLKGAAAVALDEFVYSPQAEVLAAR